MPLPTGLGQYEFQRLLLPSRDIDKFHHLKLQKDERGLPALRELEALAQTLDLRAFFGVAGPIEIEIGCGKGGFLVEYCQRHPEKPFLGLEWDAEIAALAAKRISKRPQIPHVRLVLGDAFYFLRDFLPADCADAVHIYFPDPWPKKRHHKKRSMKPEFLEQIRRVALPGALLHWGTDHAEYHQSASQLLHETPWMELVQSDAEPTEGIMTNFEKKYRAQGKPIYRSVWRIRKAPPSSAEG